MDFLTHLQNHEPHETWSNLAAAAEKRFSEALTLKTTPGKELGAIYLLGYVVEIYLKVGFYRLSGLKPMDAISGTAFASIRHWLRKNGYRNAHDLQGLLHLLKVERARLGITWSPEESKDLQNAVDLVSKNWSESLRYRYARPNNQYLNDAFRGCTWVLTHRTLLWRK